MSWDIQPLLNKITLDNLITNYGKVTHAIGQIIEAVGLNVTVGTVCGITTSDGECLAEVVGFKATTTLLMSYDVSPRLAPGALIRPYQEYSSIKVSHAMLGRVINAFGDAIDGKGPILATDEIPLESQPINPLERKSITTRFHTGVKIIDGIIPMGYGQRMGVFAGSGVGKSTLLGMMASHADVDINVIVLTGERGREVKDFMSHSLGVEGLKKSVVIVATADESALVRKRAVFAGHAIAAYFCSQGLRVLLTVDSITRCAMAQREIGLSIGEPPTSRGYTPSVFSLIPKICERAGNFENKGSITAVYTVLVEGDDFEEPIADHMRAILDGHIVLTRELAHKGQYPAVDILQSHSRLANHLLTVDENETVRKLKNCHQQVQSKADMIALGMVEKGKNIYLDKLIEVDERLMKYLQQDAVQKIDISTTISDLKSLMSEV